MQIQQWKFAHVSIWVGFHSLKSHQLGVSPSKMLLCEAVVELVDGHEVLADEREPGLLHLVPLVRHAVRWVLVYSLTRLLILNG